MKICFGCFEQYDDSFDICPHCGYAEGTEPELATYMRPGAILNERYVIGRALGHGGFSVTYLAWDALLLHKVAIKEYLPSEYATRRPGESRLTIFSGKEGEYFQFGKEKFLDEAKRLSAFQNEDGIVHVYDCFSANETAYLVMEYLDGITLSEYLKKEAAVLPQGRIAPEEAISMLTPVMLSLQRVHDSGMIHRDIAPDNIMLLKDGGVRLIDFGAARHAVHDCGKSMTVIIKDGYSPEEQYNSHSVQGPAADVYALSATLYQMITGITPPGAIERGEYLQKHKRDMLPPPSKFNKAVTKTQDTAILNGMALHTQDRTQSVAELYEELTAQTPVRRVQETIRKRSSFSWPLWAKITAGVLAAAIVAGGVLLYLNRKPKTDTAAEDGSYVLSPNVVNMQVVNAVTAAEDASLHLVVEGSDYDAGIEQGRILTQNPDPGTKLAPASDLLATASLGKERPVGVMDDMSSMLKDAAEDYLTRMGLSDVQINWEYVASDDEMPGAIVSQSVTAGSTLTPSSNVTISVAQPSQTPVTPVPTPPSDGSGSGGSVDISELVPSEDSYVTVRDYVGQSFDTAKADLRTVSLYGVKCELRYHPSIPSGSIIQQSPEGGEKILKGSGVYFVVSLGPQKQLVPNVLYKEQGEAERLLAQSGFGSAPKAVTSSYVALGHVAAQTPLGGSEAAPGTKISLDISSDSTSQPTQSNVTIDQFKAELDLQVGETFELADTLQYSGSASSIVWSSSNPSIAFVDADGYVVAIAPGAATVTVVVGGEAATCYVTVNDSRPLEMAGSVILEVGEAFPLSQQVDIDIDAGLVYWISADPRVASVLWNGVVTGVSEGCTFVTALYAGQVKQCTVWVLDSDSYIKVQRFDQNTTQHDAEAALQAAGVEYTVKQVYNSPAAAGCVADFDFTGYSDSDYYYISGTRTPELSISGGAAQQPADTPEEPARDPEPDKPAGRATLSITSRPNKTSYYIGDKLNTAGLTARYTDASGKAQTITSGFTTNADLSSAGSKQVTVTYQGVSTTFNVTVKTPSVTVTQEELNESLRLYATTDPAGQDVTWSSSNPNVAYFEGKTLHAAGSGTAVISATMTYNGRKYSGSTTIVVGEKQEEKEYHFAISVLGGSEEYACYSVDTNIPGYQRNQTVWAVTPSQGDWFQDTDGFLYVNRAIDCTITALYNYKKPDGSFYSATYTQTAKRTEYTFRIVSDHVADTAASIVCGINTNIPNFRVENVIWTITPATLKGWVEGAQYIIEKSSMTNGESYTLSASYVYDGRTYTDSCTFTCTWGSNNADGYSLSEAREDSWRDESAASGFSAAIPDRTSAAAPAEADRHSRNYAAR